MVLCGGTATFLKRKAALVLDEGNYSGHNLGITIDQLVAVKVKLEV